MTAETLTFDLVLISATILAWIATYAVHSTVVLGAAWLLLETALRNAPPLVRDRVVKTALLASIATALGLTSGVVKSTIAPVDVSRVVEIVRWNGLSVVPVTPASADALGATLFNARLSDPAIALRFVPALITLAWSIYAIVMVSRVVVATTRARLALGPRIDITHLETRAVFDQVLIRFKLSHITRLTTTSKIASPVALGRNEVCLPTRALVELTDDERRIVLAHEAAHLARRDPFWLLTAATMESVFFFQPLNRVMRVQLQNEAEFIADDMAVRAVGDGVTLARCLTKVAEWFSTPISEDLLQVNLLAPALAEPRASLVRRVQRLLSDRHHEPTPRTRSMQVAAMLGLPVALLVAGPSFSAGDVRTWGTPAFHWQGVVSRGQSIEIQGVMGSIRAEAWDGDSIAVSATRHGRATAPDIAFEVVPHANGTTICAIYPVQRGQRPNRCQPGSRGYLVNTRDNDVEVEFVVRVPAGVGFIAQTATGNITSGLLSAPVTVQSAAGDIDIATTSYAAAHANSGNIAIRIGKTTWSDTLRVYSASGDIDVALPANAATTIQARSQAGAVQSEFPMRSSIHHGFWRRMAVHGSTPESVEGVLGDGGRALVMSTTTGSIHLRRLR